MARINTTQFGHGTVDMEYLGLSMLKAPQILNEFIVSRYAHLPIQALFSGIYGESPDEEPWQSNMIRWKVAGIPHKPVYIISTSGSFRIKQDSEITVSDSSLYPGAKVRLEDGKTLLYVKGNKQAGPNSTTLIVQPVGNNEADVVDSTLLEPGRALNYQTANYEEGSETGHPMWWGSADHYVQALTIHRHKAEITGDAMTEAITMEMARKDGSIYKGYLPNILMNSGQSLIDFHMDAVERDLVWGQSNFNPATGEIFNTAANGKPVLMGDGLVRQLDSAYTTLYSLKDSRAAVLAAIQRMLVYLSSHTGQDTIDLVVIGGNGAKMIFMAAMQEHLFQNGQHIILNPEKSPTRIAGLDVNTFVTPFGSIKFVTSQAFNNPTVITKNLTYNGSRLPAESFDMHAFPIKRGSNGKNNIRIFAKAKMSGGKMVNRSLVFGHVQGMTGWGLTSKQQSEMAQYSNMVSTGRDSEQFEVLSQKGLIVTNPSECARLLVVRD